jgi:hypothetical protein
MTLTAILLGACAYLPTFSTPEPALAACAPYAANEELMSSCINREIVNVSDIRAVSDICSTLPTEANKECRRQWVWTASMSPEREGVDLLKVCQNDDECEFIVLESRVPDSYPEAVARCDYWVKTFAEDCVRHAVNRLLNSYPDDATLKEAAAQPHGEIIAGLIPSYLICFQRTECPDLGAMTSLCNTNLRELLSDPRSKCEMTLPDENGNIIPDPTRSGAPGSNVPPGPQGPPELGGPPAPAMP